MIVEGLDLMAPIDAERPCGEDLEDTQLMASLDAYQLFGQVHSLDSDLPWSEIRNSALAALGRSKDLRALAHLAAASLKIEGLESFFGMLTVAAGWLDLYWTDVYPRIDDDAVVRRNALSAFADRTAVLDTLRRAVIVDSRQHGRVSLRDMEIACGKSPPADGEELPDQGRIDAAFADLEAGDVDSLLQRTLSATAALKSIDSRMQDAAGSQGAPAFERLLTELGRMEMFLRDRLPERVAAPEPAASVPSPVAGSVLGLGPPPTVRPVAACAIASRQDAIAALQAVADFFRRNEPSSPVPLLLERAVRLVSKSFLEVLADLAPDGVAQARAAGGIRNEE